jgi:hypothetical protein
MLCFFISTVSIPESDFTLLAQLPALYRHCKKQEDKNMNFIDFITHHLINIDSIFDTHDSDDSQKPHQPFQFEHLQHIVAYEAVYSNINVATPTFQFKNNTSFKKQLLSFRLYFLYFSPS